MKTLYAILCFAGMPAVIFAQRQNPVSTERPVVVSFKVEEAPKNRSSVSVVLSAPALTVDHLPVVVVYRPTFSNIAFSSACGGGKVRIMTLGSEGRGLRTPDARIPLLDENQKAIGFVQVDRKDLRRLVLLIPRGWANETTQLGIPEVSPHAVRPITRHQE